MESCLVFLYDLTTETEVPTEILAEVVAEQSGRRLESDFSVVL